MDEKKIVLLSGDTRSGKTTALAKWASSRNDVAGILTPVIDGSRFFKTVPGWETFPMEATDGEACLEVGRYRFSAAGFAKACSLLAVMLSNPLYKYVIADEIGPLELDQQKGFWPLLEQIMKQKFSVIPVLVVRNQKVAELAALL